MSSRFRLLGLAVVATTLLSACGASSLSAQPTPTAESAAPTGAQFHQFPLAVVTGYTNPKKTTTLDEVKANKDLLLPCGLDTITPEIKVPKCLAAHSIIGELMRAPEKMALLPPGLVEPKVKVLPVDNKDLFGNFEKRSYTYPILATTSVLPPAWTSYINGNVNTIVSVGDICPARGVAQQALKEKRGWDWAYEGGSVKYNRIIPNPAPEGDIGFGEKIIDATPTGEPGAVADLLRGADVTVAHFPCPIGGKPDIDDAPPFTVPPEAVAQLNRRFGVDVVNLASPFMYGAGDAVALDTVTKLKAMNIKSVGSGKDSAEALKFVTQNVHGTIFAFVGFNEIPGSPAAGANRPGVAWLTKENVTNAVKAAKEKADVVMCMPQWWGDSEYHADLRGSQIEQEKWMIEAGCQNILGNGTHWAGPVHMQADYAGVHTTVGSHGNFMFGQEWSQETSEGLIMEQVFIGSKPVQVRWHPYMEYKQAQPSLIDPAGDGAGLMTRVFKASSFNYSAPK